MTNASNTGISKADASKINPLNLSTISLIWIFLTASMGVYGILLWIVAREASPLQANVDIVRTSMTFFSGVMVIISLFLRKLLLGDSRMRNELEKLNLPKAKPEEALKQAMPVMTQKWIFANVISWALNETVVVCGFMIGVILRDFTAYLPFFGVGVVLNLVMRPNFTAFHTSISKWIEARDLRG